MVYGYYGKGGSGKTFQAVQHCWRAHRRQGRDIVTNTKLVDLRVRFDPMRPHHDLVGHRTGRLGMWLPVSPETFGQEWSSGYITTLAEVIQQRNCVILLDEVYNWLMAPKPGVKTVRMEDAGVLSLEVLNWLNQDRKDGVDIVWTSRRHMEVMNTLRDNTGHLWRTEKWRFPGSSASWSLAVECDQDVADGKPKKKRAAKKWVPISGAIGDLYDTFAKVGLADGSGYGRGKSDLAELRPAQKEVMVRKLGFEAMGLDAAEYQDALDRGEPYWGIPCPPGHLAKVARRRALAVRRSEWCGRPAYVPTREP